MKLGMYNNQPVVITGTTENLQMQRVQAINVTSLLTRLDQPMSLGEKVPLTHPENLEAPITDSKQIFAVGFNYRDHMKELHIQAPKSPNIFTKYVSSIASPHTTVKIPSPQTDWETELVVVVGKGGRNLNKATAKAHIAGFMVGEDLSDRQLQFINNEPQFSLAKSYENFSPIGPWLTTPDEISNLGNLTITTTLNGVEKQHSQLKNLIFDAEALVSFMSQIVELYPGDLIFTGTPGGVGTGRKPQEFIQPGDVLEGKIEQLGRLTMKFH